MSLLYGKGGVQIENAADGETVHQRCILINGRCQIPGWNEDYVSISTTDSAGSTIFPVKGWPVCEGRFKALLMLSPGLNRMSFQVYRHTTVVGSCNLDLTYVPLLQFPPLHLAIMVAKDSPLTIDCPAAKRGGFSSTHSDLNAAIAKFRMTAYMWQAVTAEDMNSKGLGRRSFRLEEEWSVDTINQKLVCVDNRTAKYTNEATICSTAKIHIIRSDKTVAELRQVQYTQQNSKAHRKDELHKIFIAALKAYGGPFLSAANPIVAGLILDSTYSSSQDLILAHAATGAHQQHGISLGMFGSHLTYSWPRYLDEVTACLTDVSFAGDDVGNDDGICRTMSMACAVGQSAFLHMVGGAFGVVADVGFMTRDPIQHWQRKFLSVSEGDENDAYWNLRRALAFRLLPHFRLTTDPPVSSDERITVPKAYVEYDEGGNAALIVESAVGIVSLEFNLLVHPGPSVQRPMNKIRYALYELDNLFERKKPLELNAVGMNGHGIHLGNVWKLFASTRVVRVPGSDVVLRKRAVSDRLHDESERLSYRDQWDWAVLLKERGKDGSVVPAVSIDLRVGCVLDGAIVHFQDRHTVPCGPRWNYTGQHHHFGGHASEKVYLSPGVDVVKVELTLRGSHFLGMRMTLSNGMVKGELNARHGDEIVNLEPTPTEKVIGFYGHSDWRHDWGGPHQFGIITAPKDAELPETIYDLDELKNTDGGTGPRPGRNNAQVVMERIQDVELRQDEGMEDIGESDDDDEEDEEDEEEDVGESYDKMEGEEFGPPEGLALRQA